MGAEVYIYAYAGDVRLIVRAPARVNPKVGENMQLAFDANKIHLFDRETEVSILH